MGYLWGMNTIILMVLITILCPFTVPHDGEGGRCAHYTATLNGDRFPMTLIPGNPGDTQTVVVEATEPGLYELALAAVDDQGVIGPADTVRFVIECGVRGDVTGDGEVNVADISAMIMYVFRGGVWP